MCPLLVMYVLLHNSQDFSNSAPCEVHISFVQLFVVLDVTAPPSRTHSLTKKIRISVTNIGERSPMLNSPTDMLLDNIFQDELSSPNIG